MELKPYQQQVIDDLARYLEEVQATKDIREAFQKFWEQHPRSALVPKQGTAIEPYKNNVPRVPHICVKVPTAGGKTFIACNALKTIFDAFKADKPRAVVWLVPSITILDQTIKHLKDPSHPYRQKIASHFGNRVEVFDKATLLQGSGFNATSIKEQLNIMVFSFDSLRARNKEDRKVFQENGNLQSFEHLLGKESDITLGSVIKYLNPLVVVDESHNAESDLSVEMLKEVNPCFILDLTATPRNNSNIISFIDALELKRENMVKLPVIVYNHHDKTEVISSSLQLQKKLEAQAIEEEKKGGKYIRPIVLFQAQPKNGKDFSNVEEEKTNVQRLKEKLMELNIPEAQIKIKTANINEIKGIDLMSKDCEVRFIITINALKEGWDCPFAYILATLADKNSAVDVEQILGRVLRQPYVTKHQFDLLNLSYVLTASAKFMDTLQNIVKGLNRAGFSEKDYKITDGTAIAATTPSKQGEQGILFGNLTTPPTTPAAEETDESDDLTSDIDVSRIIMTTTATGGATPDNTISVAAIEQTAIQQNQDFEKAISEMERNNHPVLPNEIAKQVKTYPIKEVFQEMAAAIRLPQFFLSVPATGFFAQGDTDLMLDKENLLKDFSLSKCDTEITFDNVSAELYKVDLDVTKNEHTPTFIKLDDVARDVIFEYIFDPARKDGRVKQFTHLIMESIGNMYPISDTEIRKYVNRILEDFDDAAFENLYNRQYTYVGKIKAKIKKLSEAYAEKVFGNSLDTDKVFLKPSFEFPASISPGMTAKDIAKSLYEKEGSINGFEEQVINEVANMSNVAFWTRNLENRGFKLNGFINHFPDFIIHTKKGKTILLETKGDHLDAEQKIKLGNLWANKAGNEFRYFLVYDKREVEGTLLLDEFLGRMREM